MDGISSAIDLMDQKLTDNLRQTIKGMSNNNSMIDKLNQLFDFKWCWQIVEYRYPSDGQKAVLQGRLMLPGLGFRDGIGEGDNYKEAEDSALNNALEKLGFLSQLTLNKTAIKEIPKKSRFSVEQIEMLSKIKDALNIKNQYEITGVL